MYPLYDAFEVVNKGDGAAELQLKQGITDKDGNVLPTDTEMNFYINKDFVNTCFNWSKVNDGSQIYDFLTFKKFFFCSSSVIYFLIKVFIPCIYLYSFAISKHVLNTDM